MISIAMAAYNGEKYLREQFDSILRQTVQDFELVICDDCSTDGTVRILEEYAQKDSRIKVFVNKENLGFVKNFEKAIKLCSGEYIALSDQDDVWLPEHLEILMRNIKGKDLVCGNAVLCDDSLKMNESKTLFDVLPCDFVPQERKSCFFYLLFNNFVQGSACLFSRKLCDLVFPFPKNAYFHDHWIALFASMGRGIVYIENVLLLYRQHSKQITSNDVLSFFNLIKRFKRRKGNRAEALKSIEGVVPSDLQGIWNNVFVFYLNSNSVIGRIKNIPFYLKNYKKMYCLNSRKYMFPRLLKQLLNK